MISSAGRTIQRVVGRTFTKYEGLGNDFIVVDGRSSGPVDPALAIPWCDRRRGIGADGVLTLLEPRSPRAVARMHVTNADGSMAEMCGNGLRCVVRHLLDETAALERIAIDTDAGLLEGWRDGDDIGVTMGRARLLHGALPFETQDFRGTAVAVSVGNPHLILPAFGPEANLDDLARRFGPELECHGWFQNGVNVGFPRPAGPGALDLVVFERGAGVTEACGTGAAAAVAASLLRRELDPDRAVRVSLPGGALRVRVAAEPEANDLGAIEVSGPARKVFEGQVA